MRCVYVFCFSFTFFPIVKHTISQIKEGEEQKTNKTYKYKFKINFLSIRIELYNISFKRAQNDLKQKSYINTQLCGFDCILKTKIS